MGVLGERVGVEAQPEPGPPEAQPRARHRRCRLEALVEAPDGLDQRSLQRCVGGVEERRRDRRPGSIEAKANCLPSSCSQRAKGVSEPGAGTILPSSDAPESGCAAMKAQMRVDQARPGRRVIAEKQQRRRPSDADRRVARRPGTSGDLAFDYAQLGVEPRGELAHAPRLPSREPSSATTPRRLAAGLAVDRPSVARQGRAPVARRHDHGELGARACRPSSVTHLQLAAMMGRSRRRAVPRPRSALSFRSRATGRRRARMLPGSANCGCADGTS